MGTVLDKGARCPKPARLDLVEVYGEATIVPAGAFCVEHFLLERRRKRDEGLRTGCSGVKDPDQRCCWVEP